MGTKRSDMATGAKPTILVPIDVSDPTDPDPSLVDLLHPAEIVLLGYYPVPDQAAPEQIRDEYETDARTTIETIAEEFSDHGGSVEGVVVFTRDRATSVDRIAAEYSCDAILSPGTVSDISRVLVPLRGDPNLARIVDFVEKLLRDGDASVTLFHGVTGEEDPTQSEFILRGAVDRLVTDGFDRDRIEWHQAETESPASAIIEMATDHDIVVIGESEPSLTDRILGTTPSRILDRTGRPVLIVRSDK